MPYSQNGYSANDVNRTTVWSIPGTNRQVRLRDDDCGYLLAHFASWYDAHVEDIESGQLDDWGYAERPVRGYSDVLSNHASGTALDLNAVKHPLGTRTLTEAQKRKIRKRLRLYAGCIRGGLDYVNRADEMHYEINRDYAAVKAVAVVLRAGKTVKKVAVRALPLVDLSNVRHEARRLGTRKRAGVKRIQRALNKRLGTSLKVDGQYGMGTRAAYANWQRRLGYHGKHANGVPGLDSLTKLGTKRFRVV
jgi:hypothetical protein